MDTTETITKANLSISEAFFIFCEAINITSWYVRTTYEILDSGTGERLAGIDGQNVTVSHSAEHKSHI